VEIGCSGKHACHQHNGLVPHLVAKLHHLKGLYYQILELAIGQKLQIAFTSQRHIKEMWFNVQFTSNFSSRHNIMLMMCYVFKEM
jgi:hypothetical protein